MHELWHAFTSVWDTVLSARENYLSHHPCSMDVAPYMHSHEWMNSFSWWSGAVHTRHSQYRQTDWWLELGYGLTCSTESTAEGTGKKLKVTIEDTTTVCAVKLYIIVRMIKVTSVIRGAPGRRNSQTCDRNRKRHSVCQHHLEGTVCVSTHLEGTVCV